MDLRDRTSSTRQTVILAVICAVCQLALAPNVGIADGRANFAIVFVMCVCYLGGGERAVIGGFAAGLFFDLSTTGPIGLMALLLTVAAFLSGGTGHVSFTDSPSDVGRSYLVVTAIVTVVYQLSMLFVGQAANFGDAIVLRALPSVILDCIAFIPFAIALSRVRPSSGGLSTPTRRGRGGHFSTKGL